MQTIVAEEAHVVEEVSLGTQVTKHEEGMPSKARTMEIDVEMSTQATGTS